MNPGAIQKRFVVERDDLEHPSMQIRALLGALVLMAPVSAQEAAPDYGTQIQPVFANSCYKCHGPEHQKGGLRLDVRSAALKGGDSTDHVLVPGKSKESDLVARL